MKKIKFMYLAELFLMAVLFAAGCSKTSMDDRAGADREEISEVPDSETPESESEELAEVNKENVLPVETESLEQMPSLMTDGMEEDIRDGILFTIQGGCFPVTFDFYSEERSTKIGDHTVYINRCVYPVVTIEDHENAAAKINADIRKRVDFCQANTSTLESAEVIYYDIYKNEDGYFSLPGFCDELDFAVARADSRVLSFLVTSHHYSGGAHGLYHFIGLNYDVQTGELIEFSELSENIDGFRQSALACQQRLAVTETYQWLMFPDAVDHLEQLMQDGSWYFSSSGLVFFSDPYELGPFSSGSIEFTVPYSDLDGMGMKEKYRYERTPVIYLQSESPYFCDINGDGQEEEIQFCIDEPGHVRTDVHFVIDGINLVSQYVELSEQFSGNDYSWYWTKCFLYDMDMQDNMIEIVFQMNHSNWEENIYTPCMFFYHYEKDGSLTYLGRVEGDINGLASGL